MLEEDVCKGPAERGDPSGCSHANSALLAAFAPSPHLLPPRPTPTVHHCPRPHPPRPRAAGPQVIAGGQPDAPPVGCLLGLGAARPLLLA